MKNSILLIIAILSFLFSVLCMQRVGELQRGIKDGSVIARGNRYYCVPYVKYFYNSPAIKKGE